MAGRRPAGLGLEGHASAVAELLDFSELEGHVIRDATWPVDDVDEGGWEPLKDAASLLLAF